MLPTHELVATRDGYEIWRRKPGFEFTPVMLGKIASFIVLGPSGEAIVFAFMYSPLAAIGGNPPDEEALLDAARDLIEARITAGQLTTRDVTFEYRHGAFVGVVSPRWWIPTIA